MFSDRAVKTRSPNTGYSGRRGAAAEPEHYEANGRTCQRSCVRPIGNCYKADPAYGECVAKAMGISLDKVPRK